MQFSKTRQEEKCKPPWLHDKVEKALSKKLQAMKHLRETPPALKKKTLPRISAKTRFTIQDSKSYLYQSLFKVYEIAKTNFIRR